MKVLLVFNPFAGHKRAEKNLPRIESLFNDFGIEFELARTDYPEHGIKIVAEADFNNFDGIIAAGGDGTLYEVINGYFKNQSGKRIPIGILPIGTGNAFARDLELHVDRWQEAVKIIAGQNTHKIDVGKFNTHGQDYYYLNILGLGFVADVNKTSRKFKLLGNIAYTIAVVIETLFLRSTPTKIKVDDQTLELETTFIEISNTRYTADFLMAPDALIDDGKLDVIIAKKFNRRKLLSSFPKIFTGEHVLLPEVEAIQAKSIHIETIPPKVLTPDGELLGITPIKVECLHQAVEVFWK